MSADLTPLEVLDDAVRAFFASTGDDDGGTLSADELSGFIVVAEYRKLDPDPDNLPMTDTNAYTTGPTTTAAMAAGLAQYMRIVTERVMWHNLEPDDD